jgi:hypothetical protein
MEAVIIRSVIERGLGRDLHHDRDHGFEPGRPLGSGSKDGRVPIDIFPIVREGFCRWRADRLWNVIWQVGEWQFDRIHKATDSIQIALRILVTLLRLEREKNQSTLRWHR